MPTSPLSLVHAANDALFVRGDLDAIPTFFVPDYVVHLAAGRTLRGHDGIRAAVILTRRAFSALTLEVELLVESPDRVAWQRTLRGTQTGAYHGFPASGREIVWREMVTSRLTEGQIAEEWLVSELAERLLLSRKG
jgi:predicted ester cyclase